MTTDRKACILKLKYTGLHGYVCSIVTRIVAHVCIVAYVLQCNKCITYVVRALERNYTANTCTFTYHEIHTHSHEHADM
jgi:hypothetical protein